VTEKLYWFVLGALCVWRIAHLFSAEDGPWAILVRMRRLPGRSFWAGALDCFYCLSLWVAVPFAYLQGQTIKERISLWLAFSAAAIVVEQYVSRHEPPPPAFYFEQKGGSESDVLLRQ
jgi:hypothetical protein